MSDSNKNIFPEQPEHSTDDTRLEHEASVNQVESEPTYWETGALEDHEQAPVQYAQYDPPPNQKTNNYNNLYEAPQKKKSKVAILIAIVAVLLITFFATAFAFGDKAKNTLAMITKSPAEYLAYVVDKSVDESMDKMTKYMDVSGVGQDIAAETFAKLSYDKDTVSALLQSSLGMTIEDFEALVGISLDSVGFDMIVALEDKEIYEKLGVTLNSIDIITAEIFIDNVANEMMIRLPELSPAYLIQSLDMSEYGVDSVDTNGLNEALRVLNSDKTRDFVKRYTSIVTAEVQDVELSKGQDLTVGDLTVKANLLTISLSNETLNKIAIKLLEEAKDDEYILDLLPLFATSKEDYQYEINNALEDLKSYMTDLDDEELVVIDLFVNSDVKDLGYNLTFKEYGENHLKLGYSNIEENNKGEYEFYLTDTSSQNGLKASGNHTIRNGAYTGSAVIDILDSHNSNMSFTIKYDDLKYATKNNRLYSYGKINLSSFMMMGMEIEIEYDVEGTQQLINVYLNMGSSPLVTLETSTKYLDNYKLPEPDNNAEVYDMITDIDAYSSTMNVERFISDLSDRLGVDLESLIGAFFPY